MNIEDNDNVDLDEKTKVKVSIPKRLRLKMESVKVLTGQTVSDQVKEALEEHFDEGDEQ